MYYKTLLQRGLRQLLSSRAVLKLGFSFHGDRCRLQQALPGCADEVVNWVDLQPLARDAMGLRRGQMPGLRSVCQSLLGISLQKTCQVSDWEKRPLARTQVLYAALDAAVLPMLSEAVDYAGLQ